MNSLTIKTIFALSALGIVSTINAAPSVSLGDDVSIFVRLSTGIEYGDNVTRQPNTATDAATGATFDPRISDTIFIFRPGVEVQFGQGAASATLLASYEFREHASEDTLSGDYAHLKLSSVYDSGETLVKFSAAYDEGTTTSGAVDLTDVFVNRSSKRDISKASGSVKQRFSEITAVSVGVDYSETNYDLAALSGSESVAVPVKLFYQISDGLDAIAGYRYRDVDANGSGAGKTYKDNYYFVGVNGSILNSQWTIDLDVGLQERDGTNVDSATGAVTTSSTDGLSFGSKLALQIDANKSVYGDLSRDYKSGSNTGSSYVRTLLTVGGSLGIRQGLSATASVSVGKSEYDASTREEDLFFISGGLRYAPNEYLSVNGGLRYSDISGSGLNASTYSGTTVTLSAALRY